jgi:hypothetical protein
MPIAALLGGISLLTTLIGTGFQIAGAATQAAASQRIAGESARTEQLRRAQMMLEGDRQRREAIRQQLKASSVARIAAVQSGVSQESSGVQGGLGQIGAQTGRNIQGVKQATSISYGIFDANINIAGFQSQAAFGSGLSSMGQTISGIRVGS